MMSEAERARVAAAHIRDKRYVWNWAPDGQIPQQATVYAVYDGAELMGAGMWPSPLMDELIRQCTDPIVLWCDSEAPRRTNGRR